MKVESLHIYPIKALAGISLSNSVITSRGLQFDRRFMLTDSTGKFITQRSHPELTAFSVHLWDDKLRIAHAKAGSVEISVHPPSDEVADAIIWDDSVRVSEVSQEANTFFSDAIGSDIRLVGMPESSQRQIDLKYAKKGDSVSFADGYPILVLGTASIDELNFRLSSQDKSLVPFNRFRANIIVSGGEPWEEDTWKLMQFPEVTINLVKPCARCIVIKTDQSTGHRHAEPLETLQTYRRIDSKVLVGMNAIPSESTLGNEIRVGDSFTV